ncbi:MAG TPA: hypothetical protein VJI32_04090 [Candidatus Nanoarchaeia archaeon]|nr:hypothetical protein [Candidatus Nanoarchaeia archaeon]
MFRRRKKSPEKPDRPIAKEFEKFKEHRHKRVELRHGETLSFPIPGSDHKLEIKALTIYVIGNSEWLICGITKGGQRKSTVSFPQNQDRCFIRRDKHGNVWGLTIKFISRRNEWEKQIYTFEVSEGGFELFKAGEDKN